jgi:hypothetical protein
MRNERKLGSKRVECMQNMEKRKKKRKLEFKKIIHVNMEN